MRKVKLLTALVVLVGLIEHTIAWASMLSDVPITTREMSNKMQSEIEEALLILGEVDSIDPEEFKKIESELKEIELRNKEMFSKQGELSKRYLELEIKKIKSRGSRKIKEVESEIKKVISEFKEMESELKEMRSRIRGITSKFLKKEELQEEALYDFRKISWGMNKEQVKKMETAKLINEDEDSIAYQASVAGLDCAIFYKFTQGKLVNAGYSITQAHSNKNDYISDYNKLKKILTKKYGKPIKDFSRWKNDLYKDDK
ncbi:hypothetical protein KAW55_02220, partial [bacterium]|nr:hypothetical protein [bacterium]